MPETIARSIPVEGSLGDIVYGLTSASLARACGETMLAVPMISSQGNISISLRWYIFAGGSARAADGNASIIIVEHGSQQSPSKVCNASSMHGKGAGRWTAVRPSGGQMRLELQQPSGLRCSAMINSNGQGTSDT